MLRQEIEHELPHLKRYAYSMTRDEADAEDLVQDCVVRAISRQDQFTPDTHVRRWLFTILRNLQVDNHRRRVRRGAHVEMPQDGAQAAARPPEQVDHIHLGEVAEKLKTCRKCDQEILLLSVFSDMSHDEIADRMDIAVGTVKSRLSRTRAALSAH